MKAWFENSLDCRSRRKEAQTSLPPREIEDFSFRHNPLASAPACQSGNTLVIVMMFCGILCVALVSVLMLMQSSNMIDARALCWNDALPTAEAGVEEAITHLRYDPANFQNDGWTAASNRFTKTRPLDNGYYTVSLVPANPSYAIQPTNPPVIYSTGYVQAPLVSGYIQRTVRATTKCVIYYDSPILVKKSIDMGGNNSIIDSFDSSDPAKSTNGRYDPAKYADNAHVGCNSAVPGCISVASTRIYGDVNTKPGGSTAVTTGSVGEKSFVNSVAGIGRIEDGHSFSNLNATFIDVQPPFNGGQQLRSGRLGGTNYYYLVGNGNYYYKGSVVLGSGQGMMVVGNATVYVTGSFSLNSGAFITIASGATLRFYVGGPTFYVGGQGAANVTGNAANMTLYGLPGLTAGSYTGQAQFVGTIYAPQADWTLSGGADLFGAVVCNSLHLSGGMNIHYDEALGSKGKPQYNLASWREL